MIYRWANGMMQPLDADKARAAFVDGECYRLDEHEDRSEKSHNHYFAVLKTAWDNLPDHLQVEFPTTDDLRDWCLVKAGYRKERKIVCESKRAAVQMAAAARGLVREIAGEKNPIVIVQDELVLVYWPESQSAKAMGKTRFQDSKDAVFRVLGEILGIDPTLLTRNAGRAA